MVDLFWTERLSREPVGVTVPEPSAAPPPVPSLVFDPTRLFHALWRQRRGFLVVAIGLFAAAVIAIHLLTPVYRATALIMVDPPNAAILDPLAPQPIADPVRVDSEVEILRSSAILDAVVRAARLDADPEFSPPRSRWRSLGAWLLGTRYEPPAASGPQALRQLTAKVRIDRRGETALIAIEARSSSADKAASIANAVFTSYLDQQLRAKRVRLSAIGQRLDSQLARARALSSAADLRLENFLRDNLPSIQDPDLRDELTALRAKAADAGARRVQFEALAARSRDRAEKGDWKAFSAELTSDRLATLIVQSDSLRAAAPTGAALADPTRRMASIDTDLRREADAVIQRIATAATAAKAEETALRQRLAQRLAAPDIPSDLVLRFREAESDADALHQVVDKLTASAREADAGGDAPLADTRMIAPALAPIDPIFPDTSLFTLLSAFLAMVAGVAIAVIRDGRPSASSAKALKS